MPQLQLEIPVERAGERLDQALAALLPQFSRARLQGWIRAGYVRIDGRSWRPRDRIRGGEHVEIDASVEPVLEDRPQAIDLDIVYEDVAILVIDKPAGLVVHPAAGNRDGTLLNALLHYDPGLSVLPRAGLVHRLDKETSGLMVVARTPEAHTDLVRQLQARTVRREYLALVSGTPTGGGRIEAPIGRHPVHRKRMAVVSGGRPAVTHYRIEERFVAHTLLRVSLETGRTHQIRAHLAHAGLPIVGDPVYGGRLRLPPAPSEKLLAQLRGFRRQALHATRLGLNHPESGEPVSWERAVPEDMALLIGALRAHAR